MKITDSATGNAIRNRLKEICFKAKDAAIAEAQKEGTVDSDIEKALIDFVKSQLETFTREELILALTGFEMQVIMGALTFAAHMSGLQNDTEEQTKPE